MKQREKQEQAELFSADFQSFFTVASVAQKTRQGNDGNQELKWRFLIINICITAYF